MIPSRLRTRLPAWMGGTPGSAQRDALGLRGLGDEALTVDDSADGASGALRAVFAAPGVPLHAMAEDEARGVLVRWSAVLNALPGGVHFLSRSRAGGLEGYAAERRASATALAACVDRATGVEAKRLAFLARWAGEQAAHADRLGVAGAVRAGERYVVVTGQSPGELASRCAQVVQGHARAGIRLTRLTGRALASAVLAQWKAGEQDSPAAYPGDWSLVSLPDVRASSRQVRAVRHAAGGPITGDGEAGIDEAEAAPARRSPPSNVRRRQPLEAAR